MGAREREQGFVVSLQEATGAPTERTPGVHASPPPPRQLGLLPDADTRRRIGLVSAGYGAEKVSYSLPLEHYEFRQLYRLPLQRLLRGGTFWRETPVVIDGAVALLHTFNEIPIGRRPFVISFENELPRYFPRPTPWQASLALRVLRSRRCRRLLALSETAARVARERFVARGAGDVAAKVSVFRGGLVAPPENPPAREPLGNRPLRLLFVGADALRKGLVPALVAVERCRDDGLDVELTVVSKINRGPTYTHREYTPSADALEARLAELPFVVHHKGLPNEQVREAMRRHDALLFPTYDESLGWVVVEAGLEGLPSLTTNIFALPELIDDRRTGALVALELGAESRWQGVWDTGEAKCAAIEKADRDVAAGLAAILEQAARDPDLLPRWGAAARERMRERYAPDRAARALERIYGEELG